jgi:hypothetical protein
MSGPTASEHWLDRLAETRPTRRRFVRTLLAGAAFTVPFARGLPARAGSGCTDQNPGADPYAWRWACLISSDNSYNSAQSSCHNILRAGDAHLALYFFPLSAMSLLQAPSATGDYERARACADRATAAQLEREHNCGQRFQPGFNPCGPGGPCETCSGICCPDPRTDTGANCCTNPPAGCCKADGCHSGITDCMGG